MTSSSVQHRRALTPLDLMASSSLSNFFMKLGSPWTLIVTKSDSATILMASCRSTGSESRSEESKLM